LAHLAFIAPPLAGHINPLLTLAGELIDRGHQASFVHQSDVARLVSDARIGFEPVGASSHPPASLEASVDRMAQLGAVAGVREMIRDVASATDMLCREAPAALRRLGVDAVVADQMEAAGGLVAKHLGLPFVTTATGLPINREQGVPPPYVPWGYGTSLPYQRLNIGGWRVTDLLMRRVNAVIEAHAEAFGIGPHRRTEDCFSPLAQLAQCVRGLDFPRRELPAGFHYLGPFRQDPTEDAGLEDDGRLLVYCSLGTIQGSRAEIFHAVAAACRDLGLRLLIAHGGRLPEDAAASLPGEPVVRAFVPQRAVLARTTLAVGHAGFNTVLDALSLGVPLVAMPLAFEQPATAARLRRAGVAEVLYRKPTPQRVRAAIERVLGTPGYRRRAGELGAEIAASGGVKRAADFVEASLGIRNGARPEAATRTAMAAGDARGDSRSGSS
jgi:MGT family glycosyltransferase